MSQFNRIVYRNLFTRLTFALFVLIIHPAQASNVIIVPSDSAPTIARAMMQANDGDSIVLEDGFYREHVIVEPGIILVAQHIGSATIDGGGYGTVITLGKDCELLGVKIQNGTFGVLSRDARCVRNCQIINNWQTGIVCVRTLPIIEDNVIAHNNGSGIQLWDTRKTEDGVIRHNTLAFNGNHGVAVGGQSAATIDFNIIAFNDYLGVKVPSSGKTIVMTDNNFFGNAWSTTGYPTGNMSYDPQFVAPYKCDFSFNISACKRCTDGQVPGHRSLNNR